jgi:undecaprenyl phosphate-alpha-L-ara4N flippase subunit ArnE
MRVVDAALCVVCVGLASVGQVLMRAAAQAAQRHAGSGLLVWINCTTVLALGVYFGAMLLWLWLLGRVPLTQAISFFGLTFVIVPVLAHFYLGDPVSRGTWLGAALVISGIAVSNMPKS